MRRAVSCAASTHLWASDKATAYGHPPATKRPPEDLRIHQACLNSASASPEIRCARAGVRRITVHDMRHTCAALLAALDVHPRVAMRILRHAQIDATMNVYTEVPDAKTLRALKRLARQLST